MDKNQRRNEDTKARTNKLTVAEIEKIHELFIETGGYVNKTARHTGFSKSTVSRYATRNDWRKELPHNSIKRLDHRIKGKNITNESPLPDKDDDKNGEAEDQVMSKLVTLRGLLFQEIMVDERDEALDELPLKILPRTLAEAVKALIDIDKRIAERKETQQFTLLDTYHSILARCARLVENEPE